MLIVKAHITVQIVKAHVTVQNLNSEGSYDRANSEGTYDSTNGEGTYDSANGEGTYDSANSEGTYDTANSEGTYDSAKGEGTYDSANSEGTHLWWPKATEHILWSIIARVGQVNQHSGDFGFTISKLQPTCLTACLLSFSLPTLIIIIIIFIIFVIITILITCTIIITTSAFLVSIIKFFTRILTDSVSNFRSRCWSLSGNIFIFRFTGLLQCLCVGLDMLQAHLGLLLDGLNEEFPSSAMTFGWGELGKKFLPVHDTFLSCNPLGLKHNTNRANVWCSIVIPTELTV